MRVKFPEEIKKECHYLSPYLTTDPVKHIVVPKPDAPEDTARRLKAVQEKMHKFLYGDEQAS